MALKLSSAPATEPVTLTEAKNHLRVDISNDDSLIGVLIQAAREWVEKYTNTVLITQTWEYQTDYWFPDAFRLPKNPVISVSSITYVDTLGVTQTLDSSRYVLDENSWPARLYRVYGTVWPSVRLERNSIKITFIAGYGSSSSVPAPVKQAMLLLIGHLYENREATAPISITAVPFAVESLLAPYRLVEH